MSSIAAKFKKPSGFWKHASNQREGLVEIGKKIGVKSWEDWYNVTYTQFKTNGGRALLEIYDESHVNALMQLLPEYPWKPWKFNPFPKGLWNDIKIQRKFLDDLSKQIGVKTWQDWYQIQYHTIKEYSGTQLLQLHGGSHSKMIMEVYSEHPWEPWRFSRVSKDFWQSKENQKNFLLSLGKKLGFTRMDDWYRIQSTDIIENDGSSLLLAYNNNLSAAIMGVFPEHEWFIWRFKNIKIGTSFWMDKKNQRNFMDWLRKYLNIKTIEELYQLTQGDITENGGNGLLALYENSVPNVVMSIYKDEFQWDPEQFRHAVGYLRDKNLQREVVETVGKKLNINQWEDWYKVTLREFMDAGGTGLLRYYGGSHTSAIMGILSEHPWLGWKFEKAPKGYWDDLNNVKTYMQEVQKNLQIEKPEDWYSVTNQQVTKYKMGSLLIRYGGLLPLLQKIYPDQQWDLNASKIVKGKTQLHLFKTVNELLPDASDIHFNFPHPEMRYSTSGRSMELDVYIPSLKLAFEYQGEQHFTATPTLDGTPKLLLRDQEKREACKKAGITLIEIPYWWDLSKASLQATVHTIRPDVCPHAGPGRPIPDEEE